MRTNGDDVSDVDAAQFVLLGGVPSAALRDQSRASAPLPEPTHHAFRRKFTGVIASG